MSRLWVGVAILALLLGAGIGVIRYTDRVQTQVKELLTQSREAAEVGQWKKAAGKCFQARSLWEKHRKATAAVIDHEPMEEAEALFSRLEVWLKARDSDSYCACCAGLEVCIEAIGEAHSVNWWNFL